MFTIEIWKDIKGYEGIYQVSNLGRIKSLKYGKEVIMKPKPNTHGYIRVSITMHNKKKSIAVHRLVAETFIPNPDNKPCIDHINTNRADNRVENLRWVTYSENSYNPITNKRNSIANTGASNPNARKTKCITTGKIFETTTAASKYYNVQRENICRCCKGVVKSAGKLPDGTKLEWEYIN